MAIASENQPRTPFLSTAAKDFLRRRGGEATGVVFLIIGVVLSAILLSYDPADPSWFHATDKAPSNLLGEIGSYSADGMVRVLGLAAGGLPLLFLVWSWRLIAHKGDQRIWSRLALTCPAVLVTAVFASTHVPFVVWPYGFGLGGMFGDYCLSALIETMIGVFSADPAAMILWISLLFGLLTVALAVLALGCDRAELTTAGRFLMRSTRTVAHFVWAVGRTGVAKGAAYLHHRLSTSRSDRVAPPAPIGSRRVEPVIGEEWEPEEPVVAPPAPTLSEDAPRAPVARPPVSRKKSRQASREEQPTLALDGFDEAGAYDAPALSLLQKATTINRSQDSDAALEDNARMLESVLDDYGVRGEIVAVKPGPVVTLYELEPAPGLKASRVIGLADDIARSMCAIAARVSTVPGRNVIGIELPNAHREKVVLREMLSSPSYGDANYPLALALGKDISGQPVVANLARMPHLLIAGTTGSGKSVGINTMILSLLYRLSPKECRLIMIDPKMLELSVYDGIPHLLSPVVTDPKKAVVALKWTVREMEERYRKMSKVGVRNIDGYNAKVREAQAAGEGFSRTVQTGFDDTTGQPIYETEEFEPEELPMIVVIVDEMADLMMVAGKEIEACIQRLAQMARASGIHIIMATQRPSVDVITGTIKANFPTRISFQVTSKVDSRTILGEQGAEQLLGMGDMLYMSGGGRVTRVHGPFVSDEEVEEVVTHLKTLGAPSYVSAVTDEDDEKAGSMDEILGLGSDESSENELYDKAVMVVARDRKASTSYIQRKLQIGYNRAARLIEQMEDQGVVSQANHVGKREVLVGEIE